MKKLRNYIVVNNRKFEAISSEEQPLNTALREANYATSHNRYVFINNNVSVVWDAFTNIFSSKQKMVKVFFKEKELYCLENPSIQEVLDILNKYKNFSQFNLNELIKVKQQDEKSSLELEIEKLKKEKDILIKESKVYKEIIEKGSELLGLIKGLE